MCVRSELLSQFGGVPYSFGAGPEVLNCKQISSINCQALAHATLQAIRTEAFPLSMRSMELWFDNRLETAANPPADGWKVGDIVFSSGRAQRPAPYFFHLSVCVEVNDEGPVFSHAIKNGGPQALTFWEISDFADSGHAIYGVRRPKK